MIDEDNFDVSKLPDYMQKYYDKRIAYGCTPEEAKQRLIDFDKRCDEVITNTDNKSDN